MSTQDEDVTTIKELIHERNGAKLNVTVLDQDLRARLCEVMCSMNSVFLTYDHLT